MVATAGADEDHVCRERGHLGSRLKFERKGNRGRRQGRSNSLQLEVQNMANNRGVVYAGPGRVEVQSIDFPKLALGSRKCEHGVILKLVSTNICGSDQHMVRGRTTAPTGMKCVTS